MQSMTISRTATLGIMAAMTVSLFSCKKKDDDNNDSDNNSGVGQASGYVVGFRSSDGSADYIMSVSDLMSGTISSSGNGIEQAGWCYYGRSNSSFLAIDYTNNNCIGYGVNNGVLSEKGEFIFERLDFIEHDKNTDQLLSIGAPWGGGSYECKFQLIDPNNMAITSSVPSVIYAPKDGSGNQLNVWPTSTKIVGDKVFVPFYPLVGDTWATDQTDTAYVAVYSYPGFQKLAILKDTRTSPIGYYGGSTSIVKDENGNMYTFSTSSYAAGYTQATKPSGILKINAGEQQFDPSYFFNLEAEGYKILTGAYVSNGKIVARVIDNATDAASGVGSWAAFSSSNPICKIAIIDVNAQTLTIVSDIPLHGGQYETPFLIEDGKVYVSINNGSSAAVYRVDPQTATAEKGADIAGSELQSIYKY